MYRLLLVAVGLAEIAVPDWIVARAERLAFESPERARLRRWTIPIARLEGLLFVWFVLWGPPRGVRRTLAVLGLLMALAPGRTLEVALGAAYENGEEIEVASWVRPVARLLGVIYLLVGLAGRADALEGIGTLCIAGAHVRPWPNARD